jgi:outer membrane lipoprotein LolB
MRRALALLAVAAVLHACAHLPVGTDGLSFEERRARLEAHESREIRGRLAVDTGERAFQGSFHWQRDADAMSLLVRGPLGGGVLQVSGTRTELTVTARGETRLLTDPESELSALVGWWLPVGSLHAWLLGLPDREFPAQTTLAPDGTLASLEQRLWRVDYVSYQLASGLLIPRRIDLKHGDLALRVTIDSSQPVGPAVSALN